MPASSNVENADREELKDQAQDMREEARMVLPGVQTLFGFQLIGAFNQRFTDLQAAEQTLYFVSLILVTSSIGLLMTPAAYHRMAERGTISRYFVGVSSRLIAVAMAPLAVAIGLDVYIVARVVFPALAATAAAAMSTAVFAGLATLWFGFPLWRRARTRAG
jgi:hypothetical protein